MDIVQKVPRNHVLINGVKTSERYRFNCRLILQECFPVIFRCSQSLIKIFLFRRNNAIFPTLYCVEKRGRPNKREYNRSRGRQDRESFLVNFGNIWKWNSEVSYSVKTLTNNEFVISRVFALPGCRHSQSLART